MDLSNVEPEEEQVEEVVLAGVWEIAQVDNVPRPISNSESSHSPSFKVGRVPAAESSHFPRSSADRVSYSESSHFPYSKVGRTSFVSKNRFEALADDEVDEVGIYQVEGERVKRHGLQRGGRG